MTRTTTLTPLNYLILALLSREPQSGYRICRMIEAMPIGAISASPGSVYPSLKKLLTHGYLLSKVYGGDVKQRKHYRPSAKGKRALTRWLDEPVTAKTAVRSPEILFIKLSFSGKDPTLLGIQMENLHAELANTLDDLREYQTASQNAMGDGGRLAVDLSIRLANLLYEWTGSLVNTMTDRSRTPQSS